MVVLSGSEHPSFYDKYKFNLDGYTTVGPLKVSPDGSAIVLFASMYASEAGNDFSLTYLWTVNDGFIEVFMHPRHIASPATAIC